jgi:hypothetical protein
MTDSEFATVPTTLRCSMHGGKISPDDMESVQTGSGAGVCGRCISEKLFPKARLNYNEDEETYPHESKRPGPRMKMK